jgi:hypothetical protein
MNASMRKKGKRFMPLGKIVPDILSDADPDIKCAVRVRRQRPGVRLAVEISKVAVAAAAIKA